VRRFSDWAKVAGSAATVVHAITNTAYPSGPRFSPEESSIVLGFDSDVPSHSRKTADGKMATRNMERMALRDPTQRVRFDDYFYGDVDW